MGARTLDCLCLVKGRGFAIETKAPGKHPTANQLSIMDAIAAAGNFVLVIDTVAEAKRLQEILANAGIDLAPE